MNAFENQKNNSAENLVTVRNTSFNLLKNKE